MDRTMSTFVVLHTPVTYAPNVLAICTANVPTPPDAPMINTSCPDSTRPWSRRPCRAGKPEMAITAACSKVRFSGLGASLSSRAHAYSAQEPLPMPNTSSPGWKRLTFLPSASTTPATSEPMTGFLGAEAVASEAYRVGQTRHDVSDAPIHASRMHVN